MRMKIRQRLRELTNHRSILAEKSNKSIFHKKENELRRRCESTKLSKEISQHIVKSKLTLTVKNIIFNTNLNDFKNKME